MSVAFACGSAVAFTGVCAFRIRKETKEKIVRAEKIAEQIARSVLELEPVEVEDEPEHEEEVKTNRTKKVLVSFDPDDPVRDYSIPSPIRL